MSLELINFADLSIEARLNFVKTLLTSRAIVTEQNLQIITNLPFAQERKGAVEAALLVKETRDAFCDVREDINAVLGSTFSEDSKNYPRNMDISEVLASIAKRANPKECQAALHVIEVVCFRFQEKFIDPEKYDEAVRVGAMSHHAVNFAQQFYKASDERIKPMVHSYIIYFAAVEGLALGVYTNSHLLALHPDAEYLKIENGPMIAIRFNDEKEIKKATAGEIFEGKIASPISSIGDGHYTSITTPKDERS